MGRRNTKAKIILEEMQQQIQAAQWDVHQATARLEGLQMAFETAQRNLAPQLRQDIATKAKGGTVGALLQSAERRSTPKKSSTKKRAELPTADVVARGCLHRFDINGGKTCGSAEDSGIHDPAMGYSGYHPFVSSARSVQPQSPANGAESNGGVNLETQPEDAGVVAHGASGGD